MNEIPDDLLHPRREIQNVLLSGDIETLLKKAGALHGHFCPGLALGVKAVQAGFTRLDITDNSGMEEIMAVVECNNCFVDGIQFAGGCTLGNNALVYQDLGKTAVTFYRRNGDKAVRLCVKSFDLPHEPPEEKKEGDALFEKAVKRREELTESERKRMKEIWIRRSFATVTTPAEKLFEISECSPPLLPFAPIVDSQVCSACEEKVMETKVQLRNGDPVCFRCAGEEFRMVLGKGIITGSAR